MRREQVEIHCPRTAAHVRLGEQTNANKRDTIQSPFPPEGRGQEQQVTHSTFVAAAASERSSAQFVDPSASCLCYRSGSAFDSFAHSQRQGRRLQTSEIAVSAENDQSYPPPTRSEGTTTENTSQAGSVASTAELGWDRDDLPPTEATDTLIEDMKRASKHEICVHPGLWCEGLRGLLEMPKSVMSPWPVPTSGDSYIYLWEPVTTRQNHRTTHFAASLNPEYRRKYNADDVRLPKVPRAKSALMLRGAPTRSFTKSDSLRLLRRNSIRANSLRASSIVRGRSKVGSGKYDDLPESYTHHLPSGSNDLTQSTRPADEGIMGTKGTSSSRWAFVPSRSNIHNGIGDRGTEDKDAAVPPRYHDGSADEEDAIDILASTKTIQSSAPGRRSTESNSPPVQRSQTRRSCDSPGTLAVPSQMPVAPLVPFKQITVIDRDRKLSANGSAAGSLRHTCGRDTSDRARPAHKHPYSASKASSALFQAVAVGESALLTNKLCSAQPPRPSQHSQPAFRNTLTSTSALALDLETRLRSRITSRHVKIPAVWRAVKSFLKT